MADVAMHGVSLAKIKLMNRPIGTKFNFHIVSIVYNPATQSQIGLLLSGGWLAGRNGRNDGGQGVSVDQKKTRLSGDTFLPQK